MRYKLVIFFFLLPGLRSFAQLNSSLEEKLSISGFCLCKTTLADLDSMDNNLKKKLTLKKWTCVTTDLHKIPDSKIEKGYY